MPKGPKLEPKGWARCGVSEPPQAHRAPLLTRKRSGWASPERSDSRLKVFLHSTTPDGLSWHLKLHGLLLVLYLTKSYRIRSLQ